MWTMTLKTDFQTLDLLGAIELVGGTRIKGGHQYSVLIFLPASTAVVTQQLNQSFPHKTEEIEKKSKAACLRKEFFTPGSALPGFK